MPDELDPRKMAQDALELASKATGEGWFYWELEDRKGYAVDVMTRERWVAERVWDEPDAKLIAASRQLVPDLAAALLATLDRVDELAAKYETGNKLVLDLDKSHVVQFPHTNEAANVAQFMGNQYSYAYFPDDTCPFCHHKSHADLGCRLCNCKEHKKGKVGN